MKGKPEAVVEKILEGKMEKFYEEACLLDQPFIKEASQTISQLIASKVAKLGENISVRRFARESNKKPRQHAWAFSCLQRQMLPARGRQARRTILGLTRLFKRSTPEPTRET